MDKNVMKQFLTANRTLDPELIVKAAEMSKVFDEYTQNVVDFQQTIIAVLLEQLEAATGRSKPKLNDDQRRRIAVKGKPLGREGIGGLTDLFAPATILAWHRRLVGEKYTPQTRNISKGGRPPVCDETIDFVLRIARENRGWSPHRIAGYCRHFGYQVSASSVRRILVAYGLPPKDRSRKSTWNDFINSHRHVLATTDFFSVEVHTPRGLQREMVMFVTDLDTRELNITGMHPYPDSNWTTQMARHLTDPEAGFLRNKKYLIHDRDPVFNERFDNTLRAADVEPVRTQPKSPDMNAQAESCVARIREELLNKLLFTRPEQLWYSLKSYEHWYNHYRPHRGLNGQIPLPLPQPATGPIETIEFLGGLLKGYRRVAPSSRQAA